MELKEIRQEIDKLDRELIELFKARMDCARKVGEYKLKNNLPILNTERENEILDNVEHSCGEYGYAARQLFASIMELSRALQHDIVGSGKEMRALLKNSEKEPSLPPDQLRVACQGIRGANSHEAATVLFPSVEPDFYPSWKDVFAAVDEGRADCGVLPVENSSAGSVGDVYDLILKYRFYITKALDLPINHCLCALKQSELEDIEQVWSHPQALSQCSNYIADNKLKAVPFSNTAVAARAVAEEKRLSCAAICSEQASREYGLKVLKKGIQNSEDNSTRFIVISKKLYIPENADKISLCFCLPHVTGSLHNVLCRFASHGLNLTKIESRPLPGKSFEYLFYLDFTGNVREEHVMNLMCALSEELPEFSFIGNYSESAEGTSSLRSPAQL